MLPPHLAWVQVSVIFYAFQDLLFLVLLVVLVHAGLLLLHYLLVVLCDHPVEYDYPFPSHLVQTFSLALYDGHSRWFVQEYVVEQAACH